eukprot:7390655-Prymnesium_polylepis.1
MPPAPNATAVPPPAAAAPAAAVLLPPPSVDSFLRDHVRPRTGCEKCAVAHGPDPTVRSQFATEGGKGRLRDASKKRACPLAEHAISASTDGVPLLDRYEREIRSEDHQEAAAVLSVYERRLSSRMPWAAAV